MTCPFCRKNVARGAAECPRCHTDLTQTPTANTTNGRVRSPHARPALVLGVTLIAVGAIASSAVAALAGLALAAGGGYLLREPTLATTEAPSWWIPAEEMERAREASRRARARS